MPRAHTLTEADVVRLLEQCRDGFTGARDRFLIALLYRAGLRVGEAVGLELADIRHEGEDLVVRVEKPKGYQREKGAADPRTLLIDAWCAPYLAAWLAERGIAPGPLFVNRRGGRVTTTYYRDRIRQLARRAGVEGHVHPHALRHTFAAEVHRATKDVRLVQKMLGHTNLGTTEIYLRGVGSTPEVLEAMRARTG
jgi:site-specific recombinase XerD